MARRRASKALKKPFDDAFPTIAQWERRVVYNSIAPEFTLTDVVNWLYPADVLAILRAAFKFTREMHPDCTEVINFPEFKVQVNLRIDCDEAQICTPMNGLIVQQEDKHGIVPTFLKCAAIVQEWNLVREVVGWFNDNATEGCARYYFPAMGNFLPPTHPFHQGGGTRYREPKQSIGLVSHKVRQAAETVTMATFCPPVEKESRGLTLTIRDPEDTHSAAKNSQPFLL